MPGRTPYQAFEAFIDPLKGALACVARAKFLVQSEAKWAVDKEHFWALSGDDGYVRLAGPSGLQLLARMRFMIIQEKRQEYGPYRVTTRGYMYGLRTSDHREVMQYHWHLSVHAHEVNPHLHIGSAQIAEDAVISQGHHLPTGRITFEAVIRMAIREFRVEPLLDAWDDVLTAAETPHILYRSWPSPATAGPPAVR
jgi:hypothetical protein